MLLTRADLRKLQKHINGIGSDIHTVVVEHMRSTQGSSNNEAIGAEDRKLYETYCLKCQDGAHASIQEFDRAILTLSAGALGLSLAFIKDIVPLNQVMNLPMLFWAWSLFGTAILLTLLSFFTSHKAFKHMQDIAYKYYIDGVREAFDARNTLSLITRYLTYSAAVTFIVALALTIVFTSSNMSHFSATIHTSSSIPRASMPDNKLPVNTVKEPLNKGVEPAGLIKVPPPQAQRSPALPTEQPVPASKPPEK